MIDDWKSKGVCQTENIDPNFFFPDTNDTIKGRHGFSISDLEEDRAKIYCHRCPVEDACLEYALINRQEYGIWGGTSEDERRKIRRNRKDKARRAKAS